MAALHLAAAGVLLIGPLAISRALARISSFPRLPFPLEAGRDAAGGLLLVTLIWMGGSAWRRAAVGESRVGLRVAWESGIAAALCSLMALVAVVGGVFSRYPFWAFGIWLAALGLRIGRGRPALGQSLAAHRILLILGLSLVWSGFRMLLAARQVDGLMASAPGVLALMGGVLFVAISAPMLLLLERGHRGNSGNRRNQRKHGKHGVSPEILISPGRNQDFWSDTISAISADPISAHLRRRLAGAAPREIRISGLTPSSTHLRP
jgi:hypothetical protein